MSMDALRQKIIAALDAITSLDDDRILRNHLGTVDATSTVFDHLSQGGVSDWEFLDGLAREIGHVVADAYPDIEWEAEVTTIAPATGAEFAILPPQNATGNWVKVVQRIPVLLEVKQPAGREQLRAGMTVTVTVEVAVAPEELFAMKV